MLQFTDKVGVLSFTQEFFYSLINESKEFAQFSVHPTTSNWDHFAYGEAKRSFLADEFDVDFFSEGCTKAVFGFFDSNFVLKIPFTEKYMWTVDGADKSKFYPDVDYCRVEVRHYQAALRAGLEKYFAAEYLVCEINNIKVYAQVRADMNCDDFKEKAYYHVSGGSSYSSYYEEYEDSEDFINLFIDYYGADDDLREFVEENSIDDLHLGNIGVKIGTMAPIFVDYSGYGSARMHNDRHPDPNDVFWHP